MNIGLFGGTFDPIQYAHMRIAHRACAEYNLHKVYFCPSVLPPWKDIHRVACYHDRYAMVSLACANVNGFVPVRLAETGFAVDEVLELKKRHPHDHLFFLMGMDAYLQLDLWHQVSQVVQLVDFIVSTRHGYTVEPPQTEFFKSLHHKTFYTMVDDPLSSTLVRERVANGEFLDSFVPPSVANYIAKTGLYRPCSTSSTPSKSSDASSLSL